MASSLTAISNHGNKKDLCNYRLAVLISLTHERDETCKVLTNVASEWKDILFLFKSAFAEEHFDPKCLTVLLIFKHDWALIKNLLTLQKEDEFRARTQSKNTTMDLKSQVSYAGKQR